jgi:hypothetical protein
MMEETAPRRRGRPATGETPKRNIRMGQTWTDGEELAGQLNMTMTAYVEEAIREKNARAERVIAKRQADQAG